MKRLTIALFMGFMSSSLFAAPVGQTFSSIGTGLDLTTIKYKNSHLQGKQSTGLHLIVNYGIDYGHDFVGLIEGKIKLGSSKIFNDAKLDYHISKVSNIGSVKGIGYGVGVKYAVSNDIELGTEYTRSNLKYGKSKVAGNAFGANASYRF
ncbi:outer membrane protein with beta-barrel domain [Nicoletella semolina]|uniref:Outer membrane protein with beta-barrel domain n=1 Tax=Nicoletella semolina TaxID=271160 RepID=A0A4R2N8Q6_9PAST|nr:hypothetical protein [Nicoletella semolina]TCP17377.1 outer membrane protein with beta-barrel domain [Nicoletella semolina]